MNKKRAIFVIFIVVLISIASLAIAYSYLDARLSGNSVRIVRPQENAFMGKITPFPAGIELITPEEFMLAFEEETRELTDEEFRLAIERDFNSTNAPAGNVMADAFERILEFTGNDFIYERTAATDRIFNVLFLGDDARIYQDRGRADSIILISYNRDTRVIKLTSFMRDMLVPSNLAGTFWNRINATHKIGGPGRTINVINNIFSLDIQRYAVVRFSGVFPLVDALGGLDLYLTAAEAYLINRIFPDFESVSAGYNLLNGRQVLAYTRIRIIDNDFVRTQRQRNVLRSIINKVFDTLNISDIFSITAFVLDHVETNVPLSEIISIGLELFTGPRPDVKEFRLPIDDSFSHGRFYDAYILAIDFEKNITALHEFVYGSAVGVRFPYFQMPEIDYLPTELIGEAEDEKTEEQIL